MDKLSVLFNPGYYLHAFNLDTHDLEFVAVDQRAFRGYAFMDSRLHLDAAGSVHVPFSEAVGAAQRHLQTEPPRTLNYLFHTGLCCSTLIARCLDQPGRYMSFREPQVLLQLCTVKRKGHPMLGTGQEISSFLDFITYCMSFAGNAGEQITIKPTNSASNLIENVLDSRRTGRLLLLYSDLESFLNAVLRHKMWRTYSRLLVTMLALDTPGGTDPRNLELERLDDLQCAALAWRLQVAHFRAVLARYPGAGIKTLDQRAFLDSPQATLGKLYAHYGYRFEPSELAAIVTGPLFERHSKDHSMEFDPRQRAAAAAETRAQYADWMAAAMAWSETQVPGATVDAFAASAL